MEETLLKKWDHSIEQFGGGESKTMWRFLLLGGNPGMECDATNARRPNTYFRQKNPLREASRKPPYATGGKEHKRNGDGTDKLNKQLLGLGTCGASHKGKFHQNNQEGEKRGGREGKCL